MDNEKRLSILEVKVEKNTDSLSSIKKDVATVLKAVFGDRENIKDEGLVGGHNDIRKVFAITLTILIAIIIDIVLRYI